MCEALHCLCTFHFTARLVELQRKWGITICHSIAAPTNISFWLRKCLSSGELGANAVLSNSKVCWRLYSVWIHTFPCVCYLWKFAYGKWFLLCVDRDGFVTLYTYIGFDYFYSIVWPVRHCDVWLSDNGVRTWWACLRIREEQWMGIFPDMCKWNEKESEHWIARFLLVFKVFIFATVGCLFYFEIKY